MKREWRDFLIDIDTAVTEALSFTEGLTIESFESDHKTRNATVRSLEVIGEASKQIPENVRGKYPDIPWRSMCALRDKLIHNYFGVDWEQIFKVCHEDLPGLSLFLKKMIALEIPKEIK